jgi:PAS domain S-box-containing protein
MLDLLTLTVVYSVACAMYAIFLAVLWVQNRSRYTGLGFLPAAFALQTAGLLLSSLREAEPPLVAFVLSNTLTLAVLPMLLAGLARFTGTRHSPTRSVILLVLFVAGMAYFSVVRADLSLRSILTAAFVVLLSAEIAALLLFRVAPSLRNVTLFPGLIFAAYAVLSLVRIVLLVISPLSPRADWFRSPPSQSIIYMTYLTLSLAVAFGLFLMVTRRLRTDERAQFAERQRAEAGLRESEARQSAMFRASPVGISLTHYPDGRLWDANEAFLRLLGLRREEAIGRLTTELEIWADPGVRQRLVEALGAQGSVRDVETVYRTRSGEPLDVFLTMELTDIRGERYILALAQDITGRKAAERERERLIGELKTALAEVKTLSGLVPICSSCKKVRDDAGYWHQVEVYLHAHSDLEFTHGLCPECVRKLYPDLASGTQAPGTEGSGPAGD